MKSRLLALGGIVTLLGTATTFGVLAQTGVPNPPPVAGQHMAEKHPHLRQARMALMRAAAQLQKADHDSAGHREKALDLTQQAIKEVEQAIAVDK